MLEHPYIGAVASLLRLDNDTQTLTCSSDGTTLKFNDEYFEQAPLDEILFALANGAMHTVLKHTQRQHERAGRIWQAATDMAVNSMLVKNDFILPPYAYYDKRFEGMYAEEIYDILQEEMVHNDSLEEAEAPTPDDAKEEQTTKSSTAHTDAPQAQSQEARSEMLPGEAFAPEVSEEDLEQIFQKYHRQGELPQGLQLLVPEYFCHTIDWRQMLYRYIAEFAKSTYSFLPPNMKYLYRGIYLPSLGSDLLRIIIAVDTSGSVDESLLSRFLGEIESIMQNYGNYEIALIIADAKVHTHHTYLPGEKLEYRLSGGGGTDFRPTFTYIETHIDHPTLLLYFTDGMGTFPQEEPTYDVMWVMPEAKDVPFGEVLILQEG